MSFWTWAWFFSSVLGATVLKNGLFLVKIDSLVTKHKIEIFVTILSTILSPFLVTRLFFSFISKFSRLQSEKKAEDQRRVDSNSIQYNWNSIQLQFLPSINILRYYPALTEEQQWSLAIIGAALAIILSYTSLVCLQVLFSQSYGIFRVFLSSFTLSLLIAVSIFATGRLQMH